MYRRIVRLPVIQNLSEINRINSSGDNTGEHRRQKRTSLPAQIEVSFGRPTAVVHFR